MAQLNAERLKSILCDDKTIETFLNCFRNGKTCEVKIENGNVVVVGIQRKIENKTPVIG